ncbi:MAG: class I SAM-dependent methyltransferase [Desulfobacula sp.]|jgi:hypothetical protein|uniref:class I SAM-dependent methyltransferase n=1 Tax=Desulfobacula sp. TaxID=2593537 RepID=UPI001DBA3291|nr:class I SAM-dependent methyltransferase [Desulfobacula sp.]MBT3486269.1 class I SAM-dependent methyltransferase [Desulfobacula sp.]MBT3805741.1 class I SAM-dependent methyltransferase [Desulfobacula sp.]MBT4025389.1 class I SAM-dependent methyltransferase [Desulfobacula sp.]MBT4200073.1 class I SAM-dependent methyltransferase [Desulfobacula sp.]
MPSSHCSQINEIVQLIIDINPEKLLDIGVGFGKYGFLAREYLELWDGRQEYKAWERKIDGIEVFEEYLTPVHDFVYSKIFVGNAIDILPTLDEEYDLILLIDVLEHFDYGEGLTILKECDKLGRNIIISMPKDIGSQSDSFGNIYETHKFQWERKHFNNFTDKFILPDTGRSLIVCIGEGFKDISTFKKYKRFKWALGRAKKIAVQILNFFHLKDPIKGFLGKFFQFHS